MNIKRSRTRWPSAAMPGSRRATSINSRRLMRSCNSARSAATVSSCACNSVSVGSDTAHHIGELLRQVADVLEAQLDEIVEQRPRLRWRDVQLGSDGVGFLRWHLPQPVEQEGGLALVFGDGVGAWRILIVKAADRIALQ